MPLPLKTIVCGMFFYAGHANRRAESEPEVRSRFKALAFVNNLDKVNMNRLISPFNGKPVLITESGSLVRGSRVAGGGSTEGTLDSVPGGGRAENGGGASFGADEFLELDVNVRRWNFMARKGLHKLTPKFGSMNVSVAFLVEGRADTEVSTCLL